MSVDSRHHSCAVCVATLNNDLQKTSLLCTYLACHALQNTMTSKAAASALLAMRGAPLCLGSSQHMHEHNTCMNTSPPVRPADGSFWCMRPTWKAIESTARNVPGGEEVQAEDVQTMADLCPDVVILRDPPQYGSRLNCSLLCCLLELSCGHHSTPDEHTCLAVGPARLHLH